MTVICLAGFMTGEPESVKAIYISTVDAEG
jgi:hypothetical protein